MTPDEEPSGQHGPTEQPNLLGPSQPAFATPDTLLQEATKILANAELRNSAEIRQRFYDKVFRVPTRPATSVSEESAQEWEPRQFYHYDPTGKDKRRHGWFIGDMPPDENGAGLNFAQVKAICDYANATLRRKEAK